MKKSEFMKQENVPQFIKDLIDDAPDDAEINFKQVELSEKDVPPTKKPLDRCKHCQERNDGGINLGPHIEALYTQLKELADLADCEGRIKQEDAYTAKGILDLMDSSVDCFDDYLCREINKRGKKE